MTSDLIKVDTITLLETETSSINQSPTIKLKSIEMANTHHSTETSSIDQLSTTKMPAQSLEREVSSDRTGNTKIISCRI